MLSSTQHIPCVISPEAPNTDPLHPSRAGSFNRTPHYNAETCKSSRLLSYKGLLKHLTLLKFIITRTTHRQGKRQPNGEHMKPIAGETIPPPGEERNRKKGKGGVDEQELEHRELFCSGLHSPRLSLSVTERGPEKSSDWSHTFSLQVNLSVPLFLETTKTLLRDETESIRKAISTTDTAGPADLWPRAKRVSYGMPERELLYSLPKPQSGSIPLHPTPHPSLKSTTTSLFYGAFLGLWRAPALKRIHPDRKKRVLHLPLLWKMGHFEEGKVPQAMSTKPSLSTGRKGSFKFTVSKVERWSSRA
ncbi:unnamed protein product [Leuciscus chuanchicus]